ncbi:hypothetical protein LJC63_11090 [Ruminococcaceae bacterium OttesenSCG-928-L11]|nr:hypothetical protein [Ruminococcaceae bacterium OttesenSCG-928-L11]
MKLYKHFDTDAMVIDVVTHPAFRGFGHLLFPLEGIAPDPDMKLDEIDPLLYHYINIDVNTTVNVINYMLDEVSAGRTIFYGIHSEQDKGNFPKTKDTGLFYFRGKPGAPFAIVCPGGAFKYLGSIHESFPIALELSKRGYNAFALQYRTGGAAIACEDLACALAAVFSNAEMLSISTENYSLWGSSAGARMVA